ncbi:FUSC family protein [Paenibacillus rhizosphaerae]|nr:FUSC family protein [Paenibacillus rhizosphaerae]
MHTYPGGRAVHKGPAPGTVRDAFRIRPLPLQWFRGIGSAVAAGLPTLVGALTGHLDYGLCASIGGFAFLYVGSETYRQRAIKLACVALGLSITFGLGALSAATPWLMVLLFGLIGALAVFGFGAFQIAGPSAMFFILTFSVGTSLPYDLHALPLRTLLVLTGGAFAWMVGMSGWLLRPHGPETKAVAGAYRGLAAFVDAIGTDLYPEKRYQAAVQLRTAEAAVSGGELRWRRNYRPTLRLMALSRKANEMFMAAVEISLDRQAAKVPAGTAASLLSIADRLQDPQQELQPKAAADIPNGHVRRLSGLLNEAAAICLGEDAGRGTVEEVTLPPSFSLRRLLSGALNPHSALLHTSLRYGIMIAAAAAVAYSLDLNRSYWVPLSCTAVMLGTTVLGTAHRAIQRTAGTVVGLFLGAFLLSLRPEGIYIALIMAVLQFIIELIYLRNYALAVIFITPSSLLIAESSHPDTAVSFFISARLTDILIGSAIGIIGMLLLWRRASSNKLPRALAGVIRMEGKLLESILSSSPPNRVTTWTNELENALIRLRLLYDGALAESVGRRNQASSWWPALDAVQHIGYALITAAGNAQNHAAAREASSDYSLLFEQMAQAAERQLPPDLANIPALSSIPALQIRDRTAQSPAFKSS